ncbi:protein cgi121 [Talaromyces proteolyticus]|uniref:EKC/KEOPS complex subunit CGI121 n=1 Tax=Talaromyces proteolyticus TaxID=1131652 RepID=A0AAD4Q2C8_9EURO|nr:protein cgi121 [Talaromyces proteolyticus]KAH8700312.1 protein cgi121 [Talaromyces proteolyticus]
MSFLETAHLSHLPQDTPVHVALYKDLKNASYLKEQLISGNTKFQYAFLDASTILSRQHVFAAVFRAVNDYLNGRLRSHNVHSEIVVSLSPTNNISESFRRFGITDATKDLLVIKVSVTPEITHGSVAEHLTKSVEATPVSFDDETISSMSDISRIRKIYKIAQSSSKSGDDAAVNGHVVRELEVSIIGAIALRGAT